MKVERISDTQVKVTLYANDLNDRNINISELAYGTEKTIGLFREMMEQAVAECGFKFTNSPLMIEATPLSSDSLMLIITVINETNLSQDSGMNFLKELNKIKEYARRNLDGAKGKIKKTPQETALVFSFSSIDESALAASRLISVFSGISQLVKKDGLFFLVLDNNQHENKPSLKKLEAVLSEYGKKQHSNALFISHLKEHGEVIIAESAVFKLSFYVNN